MRGITLAALLAASAAACVRAPDPMTFSEDAVSVHALIRASETETRLWLHRTTPSGPAAVAGATLTLSSGATVVSLEPVTPETAEGCFPYFGNDAPPVAPPGCFRAVLPPPAPGSRWTLSATVPGYGVVSGATTVPALPVLSSPAAGSRYTASMPGAGREPIEIPVAWSAPGAARVDVTIRPGVAYRNGEVVEAATCSAWADTPYPVHDRDERSFTMRVYGMACGDRNGIVQWDSAAVDLVVTAYDSAYAAYGLQGGSASRNTGGRGLVGAHGVFGSAAAASRRLVFLPPG